MDFEGNVYLVGPMGAGKTTIGRLLADFLQLEFRDVDREIEERSGVDIPWIFDKEGEAGFRDRESAMLEELAGHQGLLVATGGGAIQRETNRRLMKASGKIVYLHASIDEQVRRTARDRKRPLLQQGDPRQVLTELMQRREPLYREVADVVTITDGRSPRSVAQEICRSLAP